MPSGMKESQESAVFIEHVDVDTFCRFAEFIHSGHYSTPAPAEAPSAATSALGLLVPEKQSEFLPPPPPPAIFAEQATESRVIPFPVELGSSFVHSRTMRYAPIFECHVNMYRFAREYLVLGLKEVARENLSNVLDRLHCFPEQTGDICHLIRLVYNHDDGRLDPLDPMSLHGIVLKYVMMNFEVLLNSNSFRDLLSEGGPFTYDFGVGNIAFWR